MANYPLIIPVTPSYLEHWSDRITLKFRTVHPVIYYYYTIKFDIIMTCFFSPLADIWVQLFKTNDNVSVSLKFQTISEIHQDFC